MGLDPRTQGDARAKKDADVCNGYLPTESANEEERKTGCAECRDCGCHCAFTNPTEAIATTQKPYALRFAG